MLYIKELKPFIKMLYIKELKPSLNKQTDSVKAKVFIP